MIHHNVSTIMLVCVQFMSRHVMSCELTVVIPTINPQTQEFCDKLGIANPFIPMRGQLPW